LLLFAVAAAEQMLVLPPQMRMSPPTVPPIVINLAGDSWTELAPCNDNNQVDAQPFAAKEWFKRYDRHYEVKKGDPSQVQRLLDQWMQFFDTAKIQAAQAARIARIRAERAEADAAVQDENVDLANGVAMIEESPDALPVSPRKARFLRRFTIQKGAKARPAKNKMLAVDLVSYDMGFDPSKKAGEGSAQAFNAWIRSTFATEIAAGDVTEHRPKNKVAFKGFTSAPPTPNRV